ncbi:anti-sigma regulatory factor [Nocardioides albidus]|uniref:Anti-sigma regulatory factor n=1 Tax=Nocardioides albidus TaxID=1517589 RepID=A0A5C4W7T9_9ACTN|nr:anti-sigma regulatory factor [Nocardioides albidus]TNM44172.1 anti-sigma regulatory factor [Nocardioides albidus]
MSLDVVGPGPLIRVTAREDIVRARRAAHELAIAGGVDGRRMSELALVVTVVATHLVLHGGGRLSLRELGTLGGPGLELLAFLDAPPRPWQRQRRHPASEAFGAGLSAVRRLSDDHAVAHDADGSAILWALVGRTRTPAPPSSLYVTGLVASRPDVEGAAGWKAVRRSNRVTLIAGRAAGPGSEGPAGAVVALPVRATPATTLAGLRPSVRARAAACVVELDLRHRTATAAVTGALAVRITADGHATDIAATATGPREVRVRWAHTLEAVILPTSSSDRGSGSEGAVSPPDHPGLRAAALLRDGATPADEPGLVVVARVDEDPGGG